MAEPILDLHPVRPVDRPRELPAEVVAAREEGGHARGVVLVDDQLDAVDVRQAGHEVGGVPHQGDGHVRLVAVEHPGAGADHRLRLLEVAELLDALAGDDAARHRARHHVQEPREGLREREPDRVAVHRLDLGDRAVHRGVAAGLGEHPLERVLHVLGGELPSVDRRLGVEAHAPPQLEDVGGVARLRPRLGQVALEDQRAGAHARAGPMLQEPAVGEGDHHVGLVGVHHALIEVRRIPGPDGQGTAALGGLGGYARGRGGQSRGGGGGGEELTAREHGGSLLGASLRAAPDAPSDRAASSSAIGGAARRAAPIPGQIARPQEHEGHLPQQRDHRDVQEGEPQPMGDMPPLRSRIHPITIGPTAPPA